LSNLDLRHSWQAVGAPPKKEEGEVNGETKLKNRIFKKGSILFNFDLAKKAAPPLFLVEGQADCVTLFANGLRNVVALGSTAFTPEQLELLLKNDPPIKHVIFCLDPDKAGKEGVRRAIKRIEEVFSGNVGMQVDIIQMPEGGGDPDKFVRSFGIKSFKELERLDLFSWRMKEAVEGGEDPIQVADKAVGLILNEANILRRRQMAKRLASVCAQPEEVIWAEVERRVDVDKAAVEEQKQVVIQKMVKEIQKTPSRGDRLIAEASAELQLVEKQKHGYDLRSAVAALDFAFERADKNDSRTGIYTGWNLIDDKLRGLPKFDKFISVPGCPNHGKIDSVR
jgi:DNA primase